MKASIETVDGKLTLRVLYDPALCNWEEAIAAGLASFGPKYGQAVILALPFVDSDGTEPSLGNLVLDMPGNGGGGK